MKDPLKKPVHAVLVTPTLLDKLRQEGRLQGDHPFAYTPPHKAVVLPVETKKSTSLVSKVMEQRIGIPKGGSSVAKQSVLRTRLRVMHDSVPKVPAELAPPCHECKTAACCRAFLVDITREEYESGLYGDHAIKLTPEMQEQLSLSPTSWLAFAAAQGSSMFAGRSENMYVLEGLMGQPCPFLKADNKCGIYEYRPLTCRVYTCVGDSRVTQRMRDGHE